MRFRPEQHLRRQSDFRSVRERGWRLNCGAFTLWCLRRAPSPAPDSPPAEDAGSVVAASPVAPTASVRRVGVVASAAAIGGAVKRARAKRRLREVFRQHQELVPAGCDFLLVARTAINRTQFSEIERQFIDGSRQASAREKA